MEQRQIQTVVTGLQLLAFRVLNVESEPHHGGGMGDSGRGGVAGGNPNTPRGVSIEGVACGRDAGTQAPGGRVGAPPPSPSAVEHGGAGQRKGQLWGHQVTAQKGPAGDRPVSKAGPNQPQPVLPE